MLLNEFRANNAALGAPYSDVKIAMQCINDMLPRARGNELVKSIIDLQSLVRADILSDGDVFEIANQIAEMYKKEKDLV